MPNPLGAGCTFAKWNPGALDQRPKRVAGRLVFNRVSSLPLIQADEYTEVVTHHDLAKLIEMARKVEMTDGDRDVQRRSFVYGNTHIENERITHDTIDLAAAAVAGERRG